MADTARNKHYVCFQDPSMPTATVHLERMDGKSSSAVTWCGKGVRQEHRMDRRPYARPACKKCQKRYENSRKK